MEAKSEKQEFLNNHKYYVKDNQKVSFRHRVPSWKKNQFHDAAFSIRDDYSVVIFNI